MKYFKLSGTSESKIIGVKNGIHQGEIKWKKFGNSKAQKIIEEYFSLEKYRANLNEIKQQDFAIEYVEAYKSAKLTDFFSFTPRLWGVDFLINHKVKELLDQFHMPKHIYIPATVYHQGSAYQYLALYIPHSYRLDSINFKNTIFFKGSEISGKAYFQFENEEEWNNNKAFGVEKLFFNNKFDSTLDLFALSFGGVGYYISEKIKQAIVSASLTGIVIEDPKDPELILL